LLRLAEPRSGNQTTAVLRVLGELR